MMQAVWKDKPTKVFIAITAFFVVNAIIAESIGGKLFSLEAVFGLNPSDFTLFGQSGLSYTLTCGVLLWPLEFVITDIVNEYYGLKAVKRISYIAVALILYAFFVFYIAIGTPPSAFWKTSQAASGVPDMQAGFSAIFGQGMWIIFGSLVAFLLGQLVDVFVFHKIKQRTGNKHVWLRATGSTVVSQLVDSFIVLFIAFKIGNGWSWQLVLAICLINYSYKFVMAILLTPVIYFAERRLDAYLGKELAESMKQEAMMKK
ncbi:MAG: VUT family protein [Sphingobacteriales bacterium]|nr:MAG: VUT family protein [Sphingobacteriales bacterium]